MRAPAARSTGDAEPIGYCWLQGTSMAGPHVAGVAALIVSRYGRRDARNAQMSPWQVAAMIGSTADPQACPNTLPPDYLSFTGANDGAVQECQGGAGHNSWYGNRAGGRGQRGWRLAPMRVGRAAAAARPA